MNTLQGHTFDTARDLGGNGSCWERTQKNRRAEGMEIDSPSKHWYLQVKTLAIMCLHTRSRAAKKERTVLFCCLRKIYKDSHPWRRQYRAERIPWDSTSRTICHEGPEFFISIQHELTFLLNEMKIKYQKDNYAQIAIKLPKCLLLISVLVLLCADQ